MQRTIFAATVASLLLVFMAAPSFAMNCVAYARAVTGMKVSGDAWEWWDSAAGEYSRGHRPAPGAVMVFSRTDHMWHGHVAVVRSVRSPREILIDQANWQTGIRKGTIDRAVSVIDVSPTNDWSAVRVRWEQTASYGRVNPVSGFLYGGNYMPARMVADSGSSHGRLASHGRGNDHRLVASARHGAASHLTASNRSSGSHKMLASSRKLGSKTVVVVTRGTKTSRVVLASAGHHTAPAHPAHVIVADARHTKPGRVVTASHTAAPKHVVVASHGSTAKPVALVAHGTAGKKTVAADTRHSAATHTAAAKHQTGADRHFAANTHKGSASGDKHKTPNRRVARNGKPPHRDG